MKISLKDPNLPSLLQNLDLRRNKNTDINTRKYLYDRRSLIHSTSDNFVDRAKGLTWTVETH